MTSLLLNVFTGGTTTRSELSMVETMPGNWPKESRHDIHEAANIMNDELHFHPGGDYEGLQRRGPLPPGSSPDELFFESSTSSRGSQPDRNEELSMPSYLLFEPDVSSVAESGQPDWRRYDPPTELLVCQTGSSKGIKDVLKTSIERIKARHIEEEARISAAARQERPLARGRRVSAKPRLELPTSGNPGLSPISRSPSPSMHDSQAISASSFDSGYMSESKAKSTKSGFGLGMFFRRNQKPVPAEISPLQQGSEQGDSEPIPPPLETESSTLECVSCLDDFETPEMVKLTCHSYCKECFQRLISTALESETHWPAKCCLNTIPSTNILPHLDAPTKRKYKQREHEWSIPVGERIYCSQSACSTWISPKHIKPQSNTARCPTCNHKACVTCRGPAHGGGDCPQDPTIQATINLAESEGWKRCYQCHALVEHNAGCRHMTCLCKAQFCYICSKQWKTCACSDGDLAAIQQRAENRRQEETVRTARELAEAEEVRIAIQLVEEFERAETARLALEAEVERRRQEEARRQREEERIIAVSKQFRQLNIELETLHDVQKVRMAERYESEADDLVKDRQDALNTLSLRHPNETQRLGMRSEMEISDTETKFNQEYQFRLSEERRIEDEYVDQLTTYWRGRPEAEYRIRDARDELRREQDDAYKTWNTRRQAQLQALVESENRRMKALRAKQACEIRAMDGRAKIDELEWKKKKWAENQWVGVVIQERITMLQEMEQEEYVRGA